MSFLFLALMNSCSWSNLPRELTDRVFRRDNINSKDLARCSLVCTTWRLVIGKSSLAISLRFVEEVFLFFVTDYYKKKKLCYRINDQLCCYVRVLFFSSIKKKMLLRL